MVGKRGIAAYIKSRSVKLFEKWIGPGILQSEPETKD
jgi:hypothetical protein